MELSRTTRLWLMLSLSTAYFLTELIVGILSNSMALAADAFHMLSDVLAMAVGIVAIRAASKEDFDAYQHNTYGLQRAELLGALANSVFLLALCFTIVLDAVKRLLEPAPIRHPQVVLAVGLVGLLINGGGLFIFMDYSASDGHGHVGHAHGHVGHRHGGSHSRGNSHDHGVLERLDASGGDGGGGSNGYGAVDRDVEDHGAATVHSERTLNMRAVYLHVLGDALGSLVVVISAGLVLTTPIPGEFLDPLASLVIVAVLLVTTVPLAAQTASIMLNGIPSGVDVAALRGAIIDIPAVTAVHDLHVWQLSDTKWVGSAHVTVASLRTYMETAAAVKKVFHAAGVHATTIQPELLSEAEPGGGVGGGASDGMNGNGGSWADGSDDCVRAQDLVIPQCLVRCSSTACEKLVCCDENAKDRALLR
ncbi:hypothetical protein MMPV_005045 [Pyropia vietnamensis]